MQNSQVDSAREQSDSANTMNSMIYSWWKKSWQIVVSVSSVSGVLLFYFEFAVRPGLESRYLEAKNEALTNRAEYQQKYMQADSLRRIKEKELADLRKVQLQFNSTTVSEYTQIESQHDALISSFTTLANAYSQLSSSTHLSEEERERCEDLYTETKTELEKQRLLSALATERRIQAEVELERLRKQILSNREDSAAFIEYRTLYKTTKNELEKQRILFESLTGKFAQSEFNLKILRRRFDEAPGNLVRAKEVLGFGLRHDAFQNLSEKDILSMLMKNSFYDRDKNPYGIALAHQYELASLCGDNVVIDFATGLIWQHSGTIKTMKYSDSQHYVQSLNKRGFAGFDNWRLPTLEEAMSLMMPAREENNLHLDRIFDGYQSWIWTADKRSANSVWFVNYFDGSCSYHSLDDFNYVRAVRN